MGKGSFGQGFLSLLLTLPLHTGADRPPEASAGLSPGISTLSEQRLWTADATSCYRWH